MNFGGNRSGKEITYPSFPLCKRLQSVGQPPQAIWTASVLPMAPSSPRAIYGPIAFATSSVVFGQVTHTGKAFSWPHAQNWWKNLDMCDSEMPESSNTASVLQPVPRMRKTPSTFKVMGSAASQRVAACSQAHPSPTPRRAEKEGMAPESGVEIA